MIDFNSIIEKELLNEYSGSEVKKTVIINGEKYLLKLPDPTREDNRALSYINNAISEYIGCKIFKSLGIPVQEVLIGQYKSDNGTVKIACACKDLTKLGEIIISGEQIAHGIYIDDSSKAQKASFDIARDIIEAACKNNANLNIDECLNHYYDMFVADALIGNPDRHNGNWGFISNAADNSVRLCPVYDCGSSLEPLWDDKELNESIIKNSVHNTLSVILDERGHRISYKDCLFRSDNIELNNAVLRIVPRIDIDSINGLIDEIDCISDVRKSFYKNLIAMRCRHILIPTVEKISELSNTYKDYVWKSVDEVFIKDVFYKFVKPLRDIPIDSSGEAWVFSDKANLLDFRKVTGQKLLLYDESESFIVPIKNDYDSAKSIIAAISFYCDAKKIPFSLDLDRITEPTNTLDSDVVNEKDDFEPDGLDGFDDYPSW